MNETKSRAIGLVLMASLAVNLFLAGILIVPMFQDRPPHSRDAAGPPSREGGAGPGPAPGSGQARPSKEVLKGLADAAAPTRAELSAALKEIGTARREVARVLATEPFDPQAYETATKNLRMKVEIAQDKASAILIAAAAKMPPEDRLTLLPMTSNPGAVIRFTQPPGQ
jgi:hypothetical protein